MHPGLLTIHFKSNKQNTWNENIRNIANLSQIHWINWFSIRICGQQFASQLKETKAFGILDLGRNNRISRQNYCETNMLIAIRCIFLDSCSLIHCGIFNSMYKLILHSKFHGFCDYKIWFGIQRNGQIHIWNNYVLSANDAQNQLSNCVVSH